MVTYNVVKWEGYEAFKAGACRLVDTFRAVMGAEIAIYQSRLSFFNQIPMADFAEFRERLIAGRSSAGNTTLTEFFSNSNVQLPEQGMVLTQIQAFPPDARTPEPYMAVNISVKSETPTLALLNITEWEPWLDIAHQQAKDMLWNSLTVEAQESWKENDPRDV